MFFYKPDQVHEVALQAISEVDIVVYLKVFFPPRTPAMRIFSG